MRWVNKKFSKKCFKGGYERDKDGERVFTLTDQRKGTQRKITFESWQAARKAGWKRIKE